MSGFNFKPATGKYLLRIADMWGIRPSLPMEYYCSRLPEGSKAPRNSLKWKAHLRAKIIDKMNRFYAEGDYGNE